MSVSHPVSSLSTSSLKLYTGITQGTCHQTKASITYVNSHNSQPARRKMISNSSFRKPISPRRDMLSPRTIIMLCQTQTGTRIFSPIFLSFFLSFRIHVLVQSSPSVCLSCESVVPYPSIYPCHTSHLPPTPCTLLFQGSITIHPRYTS